MCVSNPVAQAGKIPKRRTDGVCQFCGTDQTELHEHEDVCAPVHVTRYMCPSSLGCHYFSIDQTRAQRHARTPSCPVLNPDLKRMPDDVAEVVCPAI